MFNPCWSCSLACSTASSCQELLSRLLSSFCLWHRPLLLMYSGAGLDMDPSVFQTAAFPMSMNAEQVVYVPPQCKFTMHAVTPSMAQNFAPALLMPAASPVPLLLLWWKNNMIDFFFNNSDGYFCWLWGRYQLLYTKGIPIAQTQYFEEYFVIKTNIFTKNRFFPVM